MAAVLAGACAGPGYKALPSPTEADWQHIEDATQQALEDAKTGQSINWTNPETDHWGAVTPLLTYKEDDRACRDYQQTVTIEGVTQLAYGTACRDEYGNWERVDYTGLHSQRYYASYRYRYYDYPYGYPYYHHPYGFYHPYHFGHHPRHRLFLHFGHHR